jgi:hypothetical protein
MTGSLNYMEKGQIIALIENAIRTKNPEEADRAVITIFSIREANDFVSYLCQLLESDWHYDHEDIVRLLQQIANPKSVQVLFRTATRKFEYLDYDDSKPLARKCTWALADIGNDESKKALLELTKHNDKEIAAYAQKRIDNWVKEKDRKKHYT